MKTINRIIFFLSIFFVGVITSCWYQGLAYKEQIQDYYYLIATDDEKYMSIAYNDYGGSAYLNIIPSTVFAVGYNENFIIAKRHPSQFSEPINKNITNYYIIPIKNNPNNNAIGPLSLEQFYEKRKELNVPDSVKFTKEFEKLK